MRSRRLPPQAKPTEAQLRYLRRGLDQPGGKLPLFDESGQRISDQTIRRCIRAGWAEPWFHNPLKPDWLVCRLTEAGRNVVAAADSENVVSLDFTGNRLSRT